MPVDDVTKTPKDITMIVDHPIEALVLILPSSRHLQGAHLGPGGKAPASLAIDTAPLTR
jgi:hypothetical protein